MTHPVNVLRLQHGAETELLSLRLASVLSKSGDFMSQQVTYLIAQSLLLKH